MLRKIHQIDIIVNNQPIELYDPEKLNLRINNVIFKPEEITSKNGEYSFSFEIPATPKNNKIINSFCFSNKRQLRWYCVSYRCWWVVRRGGVKGGFCRSVLPLTPLECFVLNNAKHAGVDGISAAASSSAVRGGRNPANGWIRSTFLVSTRFKGTLPQPTRARNRARTKAEDSK